MNQVVEKENIENLIYEIRGKQVMLDSDLANLYGCKNGTKTVNLAVKRHINRFPERFMFQLTEEECKCLKVQVDKRNNETNNLRFQVETSSLENEYGGRRYKPYAFTEQGVAMLATVLRTEVAEDVSIRIMDAFVKMRHYIGNNTLRLSNVESKIIEHDNKINLLQESLDKLQEKKVLNEIYFDGQIYDAYSKILDIFSESKKELIIIDAYADKTTLDMISKLNINVILITKTKSILTKLDISKYKEQYNNLNIIYNDTFHDRYFIIDSDVIYHCGASINHAGSKTFSIIYLKIP